MPNRENQHNYLLILDNDFYFYIIPQAVIFGG